MLSPKKPLKKKNPSIRPLSTAVEVSESTKPKYAQFASERQRETVEQAKRIFAGKAQAAVESVQKNPALSDDQKAELLTDNKKLNTYFNNMMAAEMNRDTIKPTVDQKFLSRVADYVVNPTDAFTYAVQGQDFPKNYNAMKSAGIDPMADMRGGNLMGSALEGTVNPFSIGYDIGQGIATGDPLTIGTSALLALPGARVAKKGINALKKTPKKIVHQLDDFDDAIDGGIASFTRKQEKEDLMNRFADKYKPSDFNKNKANWEKFKDEFDNLSKKDLNKHNKEYDELFSKAFSKGLTPEQYKELRKFGTPTDPSILAGDVGLNQSRVNLGSVQLWSGDKTGSRGIGKKMSEVLGAPMNPFKSTDNPFYQGSVNEHGGNIPMFYQSAGTPIYRDTTEIPPSFDNGGNPLKTGIPARSPQYINQAFDASMASDQAYQNALAAQSALDTERTRVEDVRSAMVDTSLGAIDALAGAEGVWSKEDEIAREYLGNTFDCEGSHCNFWTTSIAREAGVTNPDIVTMPSGKTLPKGAPTPRIGGNSLHQNLMPQLGYQAISGDEAMPGDIAKLELYKTHLNWQNPYPAGPEADAWEAAQKKKGKKWIPGHSMVYLEKNEEGIHDYAGANMGIATMYQRQGGDSGVYGNPALLSDEGLKDKRMKFYRYVGATPQLQEASEGAEAMYDVARQKASGFDNALLGRKGISDLGRGAGELLGKDAYYQQRLAQIQSDDFKGNKRKAMKELEANYKEFGGNLMEEGGNPPTGNPTNPYSNPDTPQAKNIELIRQAAEKHGITNPNALIGMLSVVGKESGFIAQPEKDYSNTDNDQIRKTFRVTRGMSDAKLDELKADPEAFFNKVYGGRFHNAANEGYKYRGRGFNQMTFKSAYVKYGKKMGLDLVNNPDLMNDPVIAAEVNVLFLLDRMKQKNLDPNNFSSTGEAVKKFTQANAGWGKDASNEIKKAEKYAAMLGGGVQEPVTVTPMSGTGKLETKPATTLNPALMSSNIDISPKNFVPSAESSTPVPDNPMDTKALEAIMSPLEAKNNPTFGQSIFGSSQFDNGGKLKASRKVSSGKAVGKGKSSLVDVGENMTLAQQQAYLTMLDKKRHEEAKAYRDMEAQKNAYYKSLLYGLGGNLCGCGGNMHEYGSNMYNFGGSAAQIGGTVLSTLGSLAGNVPGIGTAVGAAAKGLGDGLQQVGEDVNSGQKINWADVGKEAAFGAAQGATGTIGTMAIGAAEAALDQATGGTLDKSKEVIVNPEEAARQNKGVGIANTAIKGLGSIASMATGDMSNMAQGVAQTMEDGGNMNAYPHNFFGTGGSHQTNPLGGIPMGMAPNGKPNLVRENEVKTPDENGQDFIVSDAIKADKRRLSKYGFDKNQIKKYKGKDMVSIFNELSRSKSKREGDKIEKTSANRDLKNFFAMHRELTDEKNQAKQTEMMKEYGGNIMENGTYPPYGNIFTGLSNLNQAMDTQGGTFGQNVSSLPTMPPATLPSSTMGLGDTIGYTPPNPADIAPDFSEFNADVPEVEGENLFNILAGYDPTLEDKNTDPYKSNPWHTAAKLTPAAGNLAMYAFGKPTGIQMGRLPEIEARKYDPRTELDLASRSFANARKAINATGAGAGSRLGNLIAAQNAQNRATAGIMKNAENINAQYASQADMANTNIRSKNIQFKAQEDTSQATADATHLGFLQEGLKGIGDVGTAEEQNRLARYYNEMYAPMYAGRFGVGVNKKDTEG
jgi:putative chitinase